MANLDLKLKENKTANYFSKWDRNLLSLTHELSGPLLAANLNLDSYLASADKEALGRLRGNLNLMDDYLANARQLIKHLPPANRTFSVNRQLADITSNLSPLATERQVR